MFSFKITIRRIIVSPSGGQLVDEQHEEEAEDEGDADALVDALLGVVRVGVPGLGDLVEFCRLQGLPGTCYQGLQAFRDDDC